MKVKVRIIGASQPPKGFEGQKEAPMDGEGNSVGDLLQHISSRINMGKPGNFPYRTRANIAGFSGYCERNRDFSLRPV